MVWDVGWRNRSTPEAECVHNVEQSREEELWRTAAKEAELLRTNKQGHRVYGLQLKKETGIGNLDGHSLYGGAVFRP